MGWSDDITKGINKYFKDKPVILHFEYMDTKRNVSNEYIKNLKRLYKFKHRYIKYDAIILCDNNALEFAKDGNLPNSRKAPKIFCGINNYSKSLISGMDNITGITEDLNFTELINIIQKIHPDNKSIYIVNDNRTKTSILNKIILKRVISENNFPQSFIFLEDYDLNGLLTKVKNLPSNSAIIMISYNKDNNFKYLSNEKVIEMISYNSPVPAYGAWKAYIENGITGGILSSGSHQGEMASQMAWEIINGRTISDIKIEKYIPGESIFDYRMINKYKIDTDRLPDGSVILNKPVSLFYKYFRVYLAIFITTLFSVSILLWNKSKYLKQQQKLKIDKEILELKIKEHTWELQENIKDMEKLFSIIGHDLRSPMTSIISMIRLYNDHGKDQRPEETTELMKLLQIGTEPVLDLLDNLLYWGKNRMSGLKPNMKKFELTDIIKNTIKLYKLQIDQKIINIESSFPDEIYVLADKYMIELVFRNLFSNSLKFTPKAGRIKISIKDLKNQFKISIEDTGSGFPEELISDLNTSHMVHSTRGTLNEKGMGVGLILCRDLLQYHGSSLEIKNNTGIGTMVSFILSSKV